MATDYGYDIAGGLDLTPTLLDEQGDSLMRNVCLRRLSNTRGSLLSARDENTVDVRDMLSEDLPPGNAGFGIMKARCSSALMADPRIFSVQIEGSLSADGHSVSLSINGVGATGPFQLTLSVDRVTISVLKS